MTQTPQTKEFHLHLVSDATGETINSVARACVSQFDHVEPVEHFWNLVRTDRQLEMVIDGIRDNPGLVMFTLVNERLRRRLQDTCREIGIPCVPVLDHLINSLAAYLGLESQSQPGRQHALDAEYFSRIDAMDFALGHDDGQTAWELHQADVILVGVSRTSKTPTCIYLANRGIKAANIPFVPGCPLPPELDQVSRPLVVGLTKDPERLIQIRRNRLRLLNQGEETSYVDPEQVRSELSEARRLYSRKGWPVIDVTRRSIEETAAEILMLLARRRPAGAEPINPVGEPAEGPRPSGPRLSPRPPHSGM
ncbi:pyruvate, water dikinase regulatory protein [Nitrospirillum sp. BR 11163]|uniref:pyruvate, water dikinase regulatory protein n=1 Tax=Nitrospirillum sp. BR 11163 TaxID=3104323 RepID=UPI002AFEBC66|nr:pyruvate, water dikinase regulatory protein [Nitrospirillum sp. BR 11163]MEA1677576.1 pyruvate, water dikinase regulatory protein [Nitrospirillum sp. BR 11163]